jgi:hypothetical protein
MEMCLTLQLCEAETTLRQYLQCGMSQTMLRNADAVRKGQRAMDSGSVKTPPVSEEDTLGTCICLAHVSNANYGFPHQSQPRPGDRGVPEERQLLLMLGLRLVRASLVGRGNWEPS